MYTQPLISFIITVCNTDSTMLRECIESITSLSLSREEREIIVVDDGSDMTPLNELDELADEVLYIRQWHSGPSAARNMGLRMATGHYVQFVDGRDLLIRAPYEHCLDIARYHNPDVVAFRSTTSDKEVETPFTYNGPTTGSEHMRSSNIQSDVRCYIMERSMLGKLQFATGMKRGDEEFTTQMLLRSERFFATDSEAYCIFRHKPTSADDASHAQSPFADTERTLVHLQGLVVPDADRAALNRRIAQLTMDYLCDIIRTTGDKQTLNNAIKRLRSHGLYPLPDKDYTQKYKYFRKMIGNSITRNMLFALIRR